MTIGHSYNIKKWNSSRNHVNSVLCIVFGETSTSRRKGNAKTVDNNEIRMCSGWWAFAKRPGNASTKWKGLYFCTHLRLFRYAGSSILLRARVVSCEDAAELGYKTRQHTKSKCEAHASKYIDTSIRNPNGHDIVDADSNVYRIILTIPF